MRDGQAKALLDDELWEPLVSAIDRAEREVLLTQLLFETGFTPRDRPLAMALEAAALRGADVRVLVNQNLTIPDSYDELRERFEGTRVRVSPFPMSPNVMHAKIVAIDGREAFLVDQPFQGRYIDDTLHSFTTPSSPREKPFHSVSLRLDGAAARRAREIAGDLFAAAGDPLGPDPALATSAPPPPARSSAARSPPPALALVRTLPDGVVPGGESLEVLREYERAIASAKRFVYLETQYFTSPRIVEALRAALAREPQLEVILVLNVLTDIPGYETVQLSRLRDLAHPRLGAFSLWSPRRVDGALALRQLYIHSKVGIVDDAWATVGSANLDSISLHEADEFPIRTPPNVEVNAVVRDPAWCVALRRRLWAEHLRDEGIWHAAPPAEGWLAHWRRVADDNARAFAAGDVDAVGRVLPFEAPTNEWRAALRGPRA